MVSLWSVERVVLVVLPLLQLDTNKQEALRKLGVINEIIKLITNDKSQEKYYHAYKIKKERMEMRVVTSETDHSKSLPTIIITSI